MTWDSTIDGCPYCKAPPGAPHALGCIGSPYDGATGVVPRLNPTPPEGRTPRPQGARVSASARLSVRLQAIAQALEDTLNEAAGEPCAFVLVLQADGVAQYVSNADRKDGRELIESLLARWKAGRADIPAHYNPDLRPPQAG